jgi:hypothetical protein
MSTDQIGLVVYKGTRPKEKDYMTRKEAAIYLEAIGYPITVTTLAKYATHDNKLKRGPSFYRYQQKFVRYSKEDLIAWVKEKRQKIV